MVQKHVTWLTYALMALLFAVSSGVATAGTVEVSLLWWLNEGRGEEYVNNMKIIEQFERLFPDIKVDLLFADWGEITDKTKVLTAAGSAPDLMWLRSEHYWDLATSAFLADLRPFMRKDPAWDTRNFLPGVLESCQVEEGIYALHRDVWAPTIHYNVDMFDEAGIAAPKPGWTFQDLLTIAKRLTNPEQRKFGMGNIQDNREPAILSFGGAFMNEAQTEFLFSSPESLAAIQYMYDLRWTAHAQPQPGELPDWYEPQFTRGEVAMMYRGPWVWAPFKKTLTFRWDVAPPVTGPAGTFTTLDGMMIGMSRTARHPDEAWQLLRFLTYDEAAQTMQVRLGIASPTVRYSRTLQAFYEEGTIAPPTVSNHVLHLTSGRAGIPVLPARVREVIDQAFTDIMDNVKGIRNAIDDAQRRALAMLQEDRARVRK